MKDKIVFMATILCISLSMAGCEKGNKTSLSETDDKTFLTELQSAPQASINEQILSEWLSDKISTIETELSQDKAIVKVKIYQGEWKEQSIYLILNNLASCTLCEIYTKEGDKITLDEKNSTDFYSASKNWKLIYVFGNGID
jgi:hypothetical protein